MRIIVALALLLAATSVDARRAPTVKEMCGPFDHSVCAVCRCGFAKGDRVWIGHRPYRLR